MIGVTLSSGVNGVYPEMAEEARQRFMRSTGLNCFVVHTMGQQNYFTKLFLYPSFNQTVVFFDADLWFLRDIDLSIYDDKEELFACLDPGREVTSGHFPLPDCRSLEIDPTRYFNSGFMIWNNRHIEIFKKAKELAETYSLLDFGEQSYLNGAVQKLGVPVTFLPQTLNYMPFAVPLEHLQMDEIKEPVTVHAAGYGGDGKIKALRYYSQKYDGQMKNLL